MATNTANLYNGTLTVKGLFSNPNSVGTTSADTLLSVIDVVTFNTAERVMMEIGAYNTDVGSFGAIYKYGLGFSNLTTGRGGDFIIEACPVSQGSYSFTDTPIKLLTLNKDGLQINGSIQASGVISGNLIGNVRGNVVFNCDTWNKSSDGANRFLFNTGDSTLFFSPSGYSFQNSAGNTILSLANTGVLTLQSSVWHVSIDGTNRFNFSPNNRTYFGSKNGYVFRSSTDTDIATLENSGNFTVPGTIGAGTFNASGNITAGAIIYTPGTISSGGTIYAANFSGNGSGLTNIPDSIVQSTYSFAPNGDGNHVAFNLYLPNRVGLYSIFVRSQGGAIWLYTIGVITRTGGGLIYYQLEKNTQSDNHRCEGVRYNSSTNRYDYLSRLENRLEINYIPGDTELLFSIDNYFYGPGLGDTTTYHASYRKIG